MFYCMNVYNNTCPKGKCQSGRLTENICPQQKNIVYSALQILIDKVQIRRIGRA